VVTKQSAKVTIVYDQTHWFHQEIARALLRLMMERGTQKIEGEICLAATYHPEMTAMVMTSLSETLGKAAVLLTDAGKDGRAHQHPAGGRHAERLPRRREVQAVDRDHRQG
jgi:hypothetical protein